MQYEVKYSTRFSKDVQRLQRRGYDISLLIDVVNKLSHNIKLEAKNKDHPLKGNWIGYRECHITPDWLLIYKVDKNKLILYMTRTGSHSDLLYR